VHEVSLGVLARTESLDLLRKHRPDLALDDPALDSIAAELGDLPLALHLAGSYLARYRRTPFGRPAAYFEAVRRSDLLAHRSLAVEGQSPTGHEQHVARTFALSYDRLRPANAIDQMALVTLARAAWFAPGEPIPRVLLRASSEVDTADEDAVLRFEDGLARLGAVGLVAEQEDGALVLHRLLAAFVRSVAGDPEAHGAQVEAAVLAEAQRLNQTGYPVPLLGWQPQLRFVTDRAAQTDSEYAAGLLNALGTHLRLIAEFESAKAAIRRALEIDEAVYGLDHPNVARDVSNLSVVLRDLADLAGAREALERALAIDEKSLGPNHPNVANRLNNLGMVLKDLGDLPGARKVLERALRIDEAVYGPDHPEVATDVNNLGLVLHDLGDLAGARAAFERTLRIGEKTVGHHPNLILTINNLGTVLRDSDDLAGARAGFEWALRIGEASFGPDHPEIATFANNLGVVLRALGDLAGAMAAQERALRIDEKSFAPDHPNIARDVNNLGLVLHDLGDLAGARAACERALRIWEQFLPADHPNIAVARDNLRSVMEEQERSASRR
jgi:tetratricopeptide (TPR) repeat protein